MLIRKLFKRAKPLPASAANTAAVVPQCKSAKTQEQGYQERRSFTRPLPVPEVEEQDWSAWMDLMEDQKPS